MKCLVIGGSQFIGAKLVEELVYAKCEVALFDNAGPPESVADRVTHIVGDKGSLGFYKDEFEEFKPNVVVHLTASNTEDAAAFVDTFRDMASHLVVTSNTNVYLAHARMKETEPGESISVPIGENSPLRDKPLKGDGNGDKCDVEMVIRNAKVPSTILRFAPVYGPKDFARRFYPLMVRMIDDRPNIYLGSTQSDWKWTHLYVDDAAKAIALAVLNPDEKNRIYNVGELKTPMMKDRMEQIGTVFGWEGRICVISNEKLPAYMQTPGDFAQDLEIDSSLIRKELGYKEPTDYYDGLAASVEWYQANPPAGMAGKTFNYEAEDALTAL